MRFYCFVASVIALTGLADAYNLAQNDARMDEEAIFDAALAETYAFNDVTAETGPTEEQKKQLFNYFDKNLDG